MNRRTRWRDGAAGWIILALAALACNAPAVSSPMGGPPSTQPVLAASATPPATVTVTPSPTPSPTLTPTPLPTATPFGCERPPDDYTIVPVGQDMVLNTRTIWMLQRAQSLYGGAHDLSRAITQGSYTTGEPASFGTHDGGGAVDLSVRDLHDWTHVFTEDFDRIILALRQVGFAAWVREPGELHPDSPIHIHAIAVGDQDLSEAAQRQLTGPEGYFRGFNGLPVDPPIPDGWGEPILCPWMVDMGYIDLRG